MRDKLTTVPSIIRQSVTTVIFDTAIERIVYRLGNMKHSEVDRQKTNLLSPMAKLKGSVAPLSPIWHAPVPWHDPFPIVELEPSGA